jgi:proteasome lid subunit RPN8/RPN11
METVTEVYLEPTLEKELIAASRRRSPFETCGVVYGSINGGVVLAEGYSLIRNTSAVPENSFSFHPEDWISAYYEAQKNQRKIVGLFHTHPQGSSFPSDSDASGSLPWGTYWIISLAGDEHEIAIYARNTQGYWKHLPVVR